MELTFASDCSSDLEKEGFNHLPKILTFRKPQNLIFKLALSDATLAEGWSFQMETRLVWKNVDPKKDLQIGCPSDFFTLDGPLGKCVQVLSARSYSDGEAACAGIGGQTFLIEDEEEAEQLRSILLNGNR